ncbi:B3 domain-containing protein Os04g0386900-like [Typha angustifolia]|uniref:B3 domain-containing protein Os04g0386900-like n=1 Tax=Typha angustifolia TaxID=59011 RepID=UPI003C2E0DA8
MAPDADQEEEESVPLSGKPYFTSILAKSQVQGPYQMVIPSRFYSFLPTECVPVVLSYRKKNWEMRYYGDRSLRRFDSGWRHFAVDNNLRIGDACVLQLMDEKNLKFEVRILRGDIPEEFAVNGQSSDSPIVIE